MKFQSIVQVILENAIESYMGLQGACKGGFFESLRLFFILFRRLLALHLVFRAVATLILNLKRC